MTADVGLLCCNAGKLTARSMCAVIAHLQPEDVIIVDESLTSGGAYWELSKVQLSSCTAVPCKRKHQHVMHPIANFTDKDAWAQSACEPYACSEHSLAEVMLVV